MAILTLDQIEDLRSNAGCDETDVNDVQLNRDYNKALSYDDDDITITFARTMVFVLRRMLGQAHKKIDISGQHVETTERRSQEFEHIEKTLLPLWEKQAGMQGAGALGVRSLDLGIDSEDDCDDYS